MSDNKSTPKNLSALFRLDFYKKKKDWKFCPTRGKDVVNSGNDSENIEETDMKDNKPGIRVAECSATEIKDSIPGVNETPGQSSPPGYFQEIEITYEYLLAVENLAFRKDDTEMSQNYFENQFNNGAESSKSIHSDFVEVPEAPKSWCADDEESLGLLDFFQSPDTTLDPQFQDSLDSDSEDVVMQDVELHSSEQLISQPPESSPNDFVEVPEAPIPEAPKSWCADDEESLGLLDFFQSPDTTLDPQYQDSLDSDSEDVVMQDVELHSSEELLSQPPESSPFTYSDCVKLLEDLTNWYAAEDEFLELPDLSRFPYTTLDPQYQDSLDSDSEDVVMQDVELHSSEELISQPPESSPNDFVEVPEAPKSWCADDEEFLGLLDLFRYLDTTLDPQCQDSLDSDSEDVVMQDVELHSSEELISQPPESSPFTYSDCVKLLEDLTNWYAAEDEFLELPDLSRFPYTTLDPQYQDSLDSDSEDVVMQDVELHSSEELLSQPPESSPNDFVEVPEAPKSWCADDEEFLGLLDLFRYLDTTLDPQCQDSLDSDSEDVVMQDVELHSSE